MGIEEKAGQAVAAAYVAASFVAGAKAADLIEEERSIVGSTQTGYGAFEGVVEHRVAADYDYPRAGVYALGVGLWTAVFGLAAYHLMLKPVGKAVGKKVANSVKTAYKSVKPVFKKIFSSKSVKAVKQL